MDDSYKDIEFFESTCGLFFPLVIFETEDKVKRKKKTVNH